MRQTTPDQTLRERALGYLTRREYSRLELKLKLQAHVVDEDLDGLLDDFQQRGWLSEARYVEQMVHARQAKFGSLKVAHELRAHGIDEELVDQAVATLQRDEKERAGKLWQKKFGKVAQSREEWAKQARFLQSRGFGTDIPSR